MDQSPYDLLGGSDKVRALVETFSEALERGLEYPHYTRPAEHRGWRVPDVLLSGNHAAIERWRREQSRVRSARTPKTA